MKIGAAFAGFLLAATLAGPASAFVALYYTTLSGLNEIPANNSPGTGTALFTIDFDTLMMEVQTTFSGLTGTTTASHIHCCTAVPGANNVGVATVLPNFTDFPLGVTSGTYDHVFDMSLLSSYNPAFVTAQGGIANAFAALTHGMATGNAYFNIHTSTFGGGEIRGLITQIPEPASLALFAFGLAGLGFAGRRREK